MDKTTQMPPIGGRRRPAVEWPSRGRLRPAPTLTIRSSPTLSSTETPNVSVSSLSFSLTVSSHSTNMLCASLQITDGGTWQETDNLSVYNTNYSLEGLQPSTSYQARVVVPIHYSHQICLRMKKLFILFYYQGGDERRKGSAIRSCR
jgi:hypothetical protein